LTPVPRLTRLRALRRERARCEAFLKAALGWGHMPLHMVKEDLERGTLLTIRVEGLPRDVMMPMKVVYRKDAPPGPATRAFIAQLAK
jgi:DNA-binding transcriptional LysR family regulator